MARASDEGEQYVQSYSVVERAELWNRYKAIMVSNIKGGRHV
jgi:hypothetical protein